LSAGRGAYFDDVAPERSFGRIRFLWLQKCRTCGAGVLVPGIRSEIELADVVLVKDEWLAEHDVVALNFDSADANDGVHCNA
jgi:hypothetical protein